MSTRAVIEQRLRAAFAPEKIEIRDDSAQHAGHASAREGGHYHVLIVAPAFAGLSPIQRHRRIYEALGDLKLAGIHALSLQALAPGEH
ncbi:MAG: BolA family protein [Pseudomonadota bacterium]